MGVCDSDYYFSCYVHRAIWLYIERIEGIFNFIVTCTVIRRMSNDKPIVALSPIFETVSVCQSQIRLLDKHGVHGVCNKNCIDCLLKCLPSNIFL